MSKETAGREGEVQIRIEEDVGQLDLRQLAEMSGPERAFLTCYLATRHSVDLVGKRAEKIRQFLGEESAAREHFEENMKLLEAAMESGAVKGFPVCVICSWALNLCQGAVLPERMGVQDQLRVSSSPYLRPLMEFHDEFENFVVVMADNHRTQIFTVTGAEVRSEESVKGRIKNHVKVGGWSQKRYERRRENQLLHYARAVVQKLEGLERELDFRRIVMVGASEALAEIQRELTGSLAGKMVEVEAVDLGGSDDELWEEIYRLYFLEERHSEKALWERIQDEYLGGSRAAMGMEEVMEAAMEGRVQQVLIGRDRGFAGRQCRDCERYTVGEVAVCGACGSERIFPVDLANKLSMHLLQTSAEVDFTDPLPELEKAGGVAALLRW